jgi:hypothetical protein
VKADLGRRCQRGLFRIAFLQRAPLVLASGNSLPDLVCGLDAQRLDCRGEGLAGGDEAFEFGEAVLEDAAPVLCGGFVGVVSLGESAPTDWS